MSYWWLGYLKHRWWKLLCYGIVVLILFVLQVGGLEYFQEKIFAVLFLQNLPVGIRFVIYGLLLLFPNILLSKNLIVFASRNQQEIINIMSEFLKISLREKMYPWFYTLKFAMAILIDREGMCIWATPQQYMMMHTGAAIISRRHYYSFYKAPDIIWEVMRNHGGTEYRDEVKFINLLKGERYVAQYASSMSAYNDFRNIPNLSIHYVNIEQVKNIPDFSIFDARDKFICIRISDIDNKRAEENFQKFNQQDLQYPETTRKKLNRNKIRIQIEISSPSTADPTIPALDWVNNALERLREMSGGKSNKGGVIES